MAYPGMPHSAFEVAAKNFSPDGAGLRRTSMNGTFYTRNKQIHAGKVPSKDCPFCEAQDSVEHRLWACPAFVDLRAIPPPEVLATIQNMPPCTRLHGWIVEDECDRDFRAALMEIPDQTGQFFLDKPEQTHLHLFVDGSCTEPRRPSMRVATWGVSLANLPEFTFQPVASG